MGPVPGEREILEAEASRLGHAERLLELAATAQASLAGEEAGADALRVGGAALREAAGLDPGAAELAGRAAALADEAAELGRDVRAYAERLAVDPARLQEVLSRLAALRDLERKYGDGPEEVLAFLGAARARLAELARAGDEREELAGRAAALEREVGDLAARVSAGRRKAAPLLARALRDEVRELGMEGAEVEVALVPLAEVGAAGAERAEFRFAGGPGQALLPLSKVASGGELSRTMLACRSVLVDLDEVPTLVFDEVDQGIGGRAGAAVGRRLARLARSRQVIVVTHLPQIAAFADRHVRVEKRAGTASAEVLEGRHRVAELSRMLSGLPGSEAAATHAEELLEQARRLKAERRRPTRRTAAPAG